MVIRDATERDIPSIAKLSCKLAEYEYEYDNNINTDAERYNNTVDWLVSWMKNNTFKVLVAEENNKIVGYSLGWIEEKDKKFFKKNIGYYCALYVEEDQRSKGIGKYLTQALLNWFKSKGIVNVHVEAYSNNPAVYFWKKMGFKMYYNRMKLSF